MGLFKKSGGGGFTGVITGYEFDSKVWEPKKKGDDPYTTLSVKLMVLLDGATESVPRFIPAGFIYDGTSISEDKQTLVNEENQDALIQENSEFGRLITSLVEKGFTGFADDADGRNFAPIVGARVTTKFVVDEELTKQYGKRKDKKDAKKEYNRGYLLVDAYHGQVEVKKGKATAAKGGAKKGAASKPAVAPAAAEQNFDEADAALLTILADAPSNTIQRAQMSSTVVKYALANNLSSDVREQLRKTLSSDEFVSRNNGWKSDAKTISL